MSELDLDELERLAKGRRDVHQSGWRQEALHDAWTELRSGYGHSNRMVADCLSEQDGTYLAALSPDVVLALIERVRRAEAGVRITREWMAESGCGCDGSDGCLLEPMCAGQLEARLRASGAL